VVVGGSGGIGSEVSRLLYAAGADLVIHGRSAGKARRLAESFEREFPESPASATTVESGLDSGSAGGFVRSLLGSGKADILVVAFGPFLRKSLETTSPEEWSEAVMLNLALPGSLVSACLPGMLDSGYGRILLFGGTRTDQIRGFASNAAYAAAKTGLGSLTKSVARAGAGRGVSCVLICPGLVDTEYLGEIERTIWAKKAPGKRLIPVRELAERAFALAMDDSGAYNGAIVSLDGGLSFG
jgi:3-oxoacyl-[acyl-carrier protein] reductase